MYEAYGWSTSLRLRTQYPPSPLRHLNKIKRTVSLSQRHHYRWFRTTFSMSHHLRFPEAFSPLSMLCLFLLPTCLWHEDLLHFLLRIDFGMKQISTTGNKTISFSPTTSNSTKHLWRWEFSVRLIVPQTSIWANSWRSDLWNIWSTR